MKHLCCIFSILLSSLYSQSDFDIVSIKLSDSARLAKNEFSGLAIHKEALFMLGQNETSSGPWSGIYTAALSDLEKSIKDTNYKAQFSRRPILNLEAVISKINNMC